MPGHALPRSFSQTLHPFKRQVLIGLTVLRATLRVAQQSPPVQQISNVNFDAFVIYQGVPRCTKVYQGVPSTRNF